MEKTEDVWLPVIGRALASLCIQTGALKEANMGAKARLLDWLGVPRRDVAAMLGTTPASITELLRLARGRRRAGKKKAR